MPLPVGYKLTTFGKPVSGPDRDPNVFFIFFIKARIITLLPREDSSVFICVITIQSPYKCLPVTACYYQLPNVSKTSLDIQNVYYRTHSLTPSETVGRHSHYVMIFVPGPFLFISWQFFLLMVFFLSRD